MSPENAPRTKFVGNQIRLDRPTLIVLGGEKKGSEFPLRTSGARCKIGSAESCDIRLPELLPEHAELFITGDGQGVRIIDLSGGSTRLNGATVHEGTLAPGGTLDLGGIELRLQNEGDTITILPSARDSFFEALGKSLAMREVFGLCEAVAATDATMLLLGETGTGKDVLARSIHSASPRASCSWVTVDCGAIAPTLIESELFGYERGAFTGAEESRAGAFERAHDGTLFLDEVGELPLDVQPKLLRAIDEREIQRLGGSRPIPINVRILAATKRDLEVEVQKGRFREDLYFRLAVIVLRLPPLRERREDIPVLVEHFAKRFGDRTGHRAKIDEGELLALAGHDWAGNVRELKNTVERALWLAQTGDGVARFFFPSSGAIFAVSDETAAAGDMAFDSSKPFSEHKQRWEDEFEHKYLAWLMARADGSMSKASRLASMDRKHLRSLLKKHGLYHEQKAETDGGTD